MLWYIIAPVIMTIAILILIKVSGDKCSVKSEEEKTATAELRDKYKGEFLKGSEIMEENKECQSMTREDATTVLESRRNKNKLWYVLGVIIVGLICFLLFFRIIILPAPDFMVIAKKYPTFSDSFIVLNDFIKRCNEATEEYNKERFKSRHPLETYLRRHNINPALHEEFYEKGLIRSEETDIE